MTAPVDYTPWLLVARAAEYARRHPVTLRVALESGELHGHQRRHRGRWHIHVASLDAWLAGERDTAAACGCAQLRHRATA